MMAFKVHDFHAVSCDITFSLQYSVKKTGQGFGCPVMKAAETAKGLKRVRWAIP